MHTHQETRIREVHTTGNIAVAMLFRRGNLLALIFLPKISTKHLPLPVSPFLLGVVTLLYLALDLDFRFHFVPPWPLVPDLFTKCTQCTGHMKSV
ncbi:hypothetical protein Pelo_10950 [Pelomyxa schiedti]|nr:hypothetical protein Pelo_10950 [Pelomyxa schiedti]